MASKLRHRRRRQRPRHTCPKCGSIGVVVTEKKGICNHCGHFQPTSYFRNSGASDETGDDRPRNPIEYGHIAPTKGSDEQ